MKSMKTSVSNVSVSFFKEINKLDWEIGTYSWEFEVQKPSSNVRIVEVILRRSSIDGTMIKASKSSGPIFVSLATTGIKRGTVLWNDSTQNPANRAADDRLEIVFSINDTSTINAQNIVNNDRLAPILSVVDTAKVYGDISQLNEMLARVTLSVTKSRANICNMNNIRSICLSKLYNIQTLAARSVGKLRDLIMLQIANSKPYIRQLVSKSPAQHYYDLLNAVEKSCAYVVDYIMHISTKAITKLHEKLNSETNEPLPDILTHLLAKAEHARSLVSGWKEPLKLELQEIYEASHLPTLVKFGKEEGFANSTMPIAKIEGSESLLMRMKELELENTILKEKMRRIKHREPRAISIVLIFLGAASLIISYLYSSLILTFIGLGLTLWGCVIFFVSPTRQVPEEIVNAVALYTIKAIDGLLVSTGYKGRTIFSYPKLCNVTKGYVFIPYDGVYTIPEDQEFAKEVVFCDSQKGIYIVAPSQGLVELFERELDVNLASVDLAYVQENLPKLLIEDLKLVDELSIEDKDGVIRARILG